MIIRDISLEEVKEAMKLRVLCWSEELASRAENTLQLDHEVMAWANWLTAAQVNNDIRLCLGAFDGSLLLGVVAASFIESKDAPECGIELNGLWVHPTYRGLGISAKLLRAVLDHFMPLGVNTIEVYNHHYAPSNMYYRKFGGQIMDQTYQMDGKLLIDIFNFDARSLYERLVMY